MDIFLRRRRIVVLALAFLLFLGKCEVKVHPSHDEPSPSSNSSGGVYLYSHTSFKSVGAPKKATDFAYDKLLPSKTVRQDCNDSCQLYLQRLDAYCHQDLLNLSLQQELAHEGRLDAREIDDQFELMHAHVMVRHGDRTPVYPYKIDTSITHECGLTDKTLSWYGISDFGDILSLPPAADLKNRFLKLHPGSLSRRCGTGMLTQLGFKQMRSLGALLLTRYKSFMKNFAAGPNYSPRDVFVHSTDVRRTMQSTAAFLVGFLPNYVSVRRPIRLYVSSGTYNHEPPLGIEKVYSSCHGYYDLLDAELKKTGYYNADKMVFHPLLERLCKMFHIPDPSQPIVNRLFDHFMTRGCHNRRDPLPCYRDQCIDFPYALKLFNYSDWNWSHKLPYNSSLVRMLPFLRHSLLEPMKKRISDDFEGDGFTFKFMLTVSHDDTIMMLLNALGYRLDAWLPYASRVVFELWRNYKLEYFVRVLYNGEVISERTIAGKDEGTSIGNGELIKFEKWSDYITTGPFRDVNTYNRVCKN